MTQKTRYNTYQILDGYIIMRSKPQLHNVRKIVFKANQNASTLYGYSDKALLKTYANPKFAKEKSVFLLEPEYIKEAFAESFKVKNYLSAEQRKSYLAKFVDEQFLGSDNQPLNGEYIYGLLPNNRLYVDHVKHNRNHSHIIAGLPAKAVGHAYFVNGHLMTLSNNSGHYKPSLEKMAEGIKWFWQRSGEFLFEDHSQFDFRCENNGLRFFKASSCLPQKNQEQLNDLPEVSEFIKDKLDDINLQKHSDVETTDIATSTEYIGRGYDKEIQQANTMQPEMMDHYLSFTSLSRNFSRYIATKNPHMYRKNKLKTL